MPWKRDEPAVAANYPHSRRSCHHYRRVRRYGFRTRCYEYFESERLDDGHGGHGYDEQCGLRSHDGKHERHDGTMPGDVSAEHAPVPEHDASSRYDAMHVNDVTRIQP